MEKITTIFIAGTTFSLTESAHAKLAEYLTTLKDHFSREANNDEIIRDIESRIAEKLIEKTGRMIVFADIEEIIAEIGQPAQLDDEEMRIEAPIDMKGRKRLYRNMDEAWLGGVASGIATYFNVNPLLIRLGFAIAALLWGASIIFYVILWILVPEAKTTVQKLEMRGIHATLENIGRIVRERTEEVREMGMIKKFFAGIKNVVYTIFQLFGKAIGFALTIVPILAMVGLTIFFGSGITNWNASFNDFPLRGAVPDGLILFGAVVIYIVILIPLILLSTGGIRLIRKKATMSTSIMLGFVGVWIIVFITGGVVGTNIARHYTETLTTDPQYQMETRDLDVSAFTKVFIADNNRITIKKGEVQSVSVRARVVDHEKFDNFGVGVENGVLTVEEKFSRNDCFFFCETTRAEITVTTPELETISVRGGVVQFDEYSDEQMSIELSHGSMYGTLSVRVLDITASHEYVEASIETDMLTVNARYAIFSLNGSAQNAVLNLAHSKFGKELFIIDSAKLDTKDSTVTAKILQRSDGDGEVEPLE